MLFTPLTLRYDVISYVLMKMKQKKNTKHTQKLKHIAKIDSRSVQINVETS